MAQRSDVVVCVENEHCQLECIGKPMCEPHDACAVSWFQGIGTQNSVLRSERTAIDFEGRLEQKYSLKYVFFFRFNFPAIFSLQEIFISLTSIEAQETKSLLVEYGTRV